MDGIMVHGKGSSGQAKKATYGLVTKYFTQ